MLSISIFNGINWQVSTVSLTHWALELFAIFWTLWWFSGWISAQLALIWSKMHLQHDSLPILPLALHFTTFWLWCVQKSKFWGEKANYIFWLFEFWIFFAFPFSPFLFFFSAVIDLLLGLLGVKKLRKRHQDGQFSPWSSQVLAGNFALSFSLNFLSIFVHTCISGSIWLITLIWGSLERSSPPTEVEHRWCQFWSKVMMSEVEERQRLVMAG